MAGCYIGYDTPKAMPHASGAGVCAPVFQEFMTKAVKKYGGGKFKVPPGGHFINIDRFTGQPLPDSASGPNVVAEYFRNGAEPVFGVAYDGGFHMGANLPLYTRNDAPGAGGSPTSVQTSDGQVKQLPGKANFGSMSAGGLY